MILRLSLDLPEDESLTVMVRHLSRTLLETLHVASQDIDDLEYVIGELTANAVRHSGDDFYTIGLDLYKDKAVVTVTDRGKGFLFEDLPLPGSSRPDEHGEERFGGWGLPLVQKLADRVEFFRTEPQGTTVRAEKQLRYDLWGTPAGTQETTDETDPEQKAKP
ncbi:MAG: ATP-binding protein [Cytophagales bacterium]|nr:ATP-binding protein [Armatimonadota bacterium]